MSDKPLVERLRFTVDNFESGSAYAIGMKDGLIDAINKIESFVRIRLTEQTEPSEEDRKAAARYAERDSIPASRIAWERMHAVNEFKRRISTLLVGKETK